MFKNYDAIAIFRIWGLFEAIRNLDTGRIVQKLKTELKISNATLWLFLWVKVLFWLKNAAFFQQNVDISKIKSALVLKGKGK